MADQSELQFESAGNANDAETIARERDELLEAVSSGQLDRVQQRVAWILNHYPDARDSDITLQLRYWEEFAPDLGGGDYIRKADLYHLPRLTSLSRARAKIQNTYSLFLASPEVRRARKKLSDAELEKAAEQRPSHPLFVVYADESGKTGKHLIVGSMWFLHPPEILTFVRELHGFREDLAFKDEFHFKEINNGNLRVYLDLVRWLSQRLNVVSFKVVSVERAGVKSVGEALETLYYHLLVRGVEHEHKSERAPLPRRLQVWKDQEEIGADKIFLAELSDRLKNAATGQFDNQLEIAELQAIDSRNQLLVQLADLFTSSINRVLNAEGARTSAKDRFADALLAMLGIPGGPVEGESEGGLALHVSL